VLTIVSLMKPIMSGLFIKKNSLRLQGLTNKFKKRKLRVDLHLLKEKILLLSKLFVLKV
jgi:hypothetical protein